MSPVCRPNRWRSWPAHRPSQRTRPRVPRRSLDAAVGARRQIIATVHVASTLLPPQFLVRPMCFLFHRANRCRGGPRNLLQGVSTHLEHRENLLLACRQARDELFKSGNVRLATGLVPCGRGYYLKGEFVRMIAESLAVAIDANMPRYPVALPPTSGSIPASTAARSRTSFPARSASVDTVCAMSDGLVG